MTRLLKELRTDAGAWLVAAMAFAFFIYGWEIIGALVTALDVWEAM